MTKRKDPKDYVKTGRPTMYNEALAIKICKAIATSTDPLQKICDRNDDFPCKQTIHEWKYDFPEFADLYAKAKREQADLFVEEVMSISDDDSEDVLVGANGLIPNSAKIQRHRLRVDTRKWIACKLLPKVYGDKVISESSVTISHEDKLKELK